MHVMPEEDCLMVNRVWAGAAIRIERIAGVHDKGARRLSLTRRIRAHQAGGRKFTKFRLFGSCLFGLGQLVLLAYQSNFSYLDGGCSRTPEAAADLTVRGHRATGATIRCVAAERRGLLTCLSRRTGVQVGAIFDLRALLTPPLAGERMVRLSNNGFSAEMLA